MATTSQDPAGWMNVCLECQRRTGRLHWCWLAWIPSAARAKRVELDRITPHKHEEIPDGTRP